MCAPVQMRCDGYSTPNAWYLAQGLNPQTPGIGSTNLNGSGLANWQEYLYGGTASLSNHFNYDTGGDSRNGQMTSMVTPYGTEHQQHPDCHLHTRP